MNYLGLTVFAGNTPGLILDFYPETKEYLVEFTDGRVIKTAKVFWDKTIPSEPDIAFYRQANLKNGERLEYDPEVGWDIISFANEEAIDIVDEPSNVGDWVDDYKEDQSADGESEEAAHSGIEEKLDQVLDMLEDVLEEHNHSEGEEANETSAVQEQDHDAVEDSYWDRTLKPNPMAMDNEFGSGSYNERNDGALPGGRAMAAKTKNPQSTPAPKKDQIKGSDKNEPGSAADTKNNIKLDEATKTSLRKKAEENNTTYETLAAVYRRGAGAFSTSHRPGVNRNQWAMARVNAFIHLLKNGKPKDPKYITDNDLLPSSHGRSTKKKESKKDCGCWDGYKRIPGTTPCAPGSCEKCDSARKESAAKKHNPDEAARKVNTVPPAGVRAAAKRGLKYYEEGKAGDGFEAATAARARKIAAGEALTEEHINRMHSFFERHAGGRSKKAKPGEVTAWDVAWLCWGGDAGRSWAAKVDAQFERARHPNAKKKRSSMGDWQIREEQIASVIEALADGHDLEAVLEKFPMVKKLYNEDPAVKSFIDEHHPGRFDSDREHEDEQQQRELYGDGKAIQDGKFVSKKTAADAGAGVFDFKNYEDDTDHMRSDIGGNSNVRHAESEADRLMESGDREGNPELRGVGDDATDPDLGEGVEFPSAPDEVIESLLQSPEFEDRIKDVVEEYLSNDEDVSRYAHVREEADWTDKHAGKGFGCPRCSDPLVNNTCYNCGDDHTAYVKRATELRRLASRLVPYADELAVLLGEAFATRTATTQDSLAEGIFVPVPIHGQDSDPSIGGTGGYNATHGDSPEYLKDVNGIGGWIDATPQEIVKTVVYILDGAIPGFKDKREKAKKKKESSFRVSNAECTICGNTYMEGGECKSPRVTTGQAENGCPAKASRPAGVGNENTTLNPATTAPGASNTAPMGVSQRSMAPMRRTITPAPSPYGFAASTTAAFDEGDDNEFDAYHQIEDGGREMPDLEIEPDAEPREEGFVDINGDPVEAGMTYQLFAGDDEEPDIIKIVDVNLDSISVERIDSAFPSDGEEPYEITLEEFQVQDMRLDPKDTVHPNEVGEDTVSPLDGTPETMDDAGPGQNDIPGVSDLSHGRESKLAGRHYYPNQQKEFINEPGEARNLDKLVLDGTHYIDGTTTSSEGFDDDFLFGV